MKKPFYSEYLDQYIDYCKHLVEANLIKKEDVATKIGLPANALKDLYENRYNFRLTKNQVNKLFEETDKISFMFFYTEEERKNIVDSYTLLAKKNKELKLSNKSLSEKEFLMLKKYSSILKRSGIIKESNNKIKETIKP